MELVDLSRRIMSWPGWAMARFVQGNDSWDVQELWLCLETLVEMMFVLGVILFPCSGAQPHIRSHKFISFV